MCGANQKAIRLKHFGLRLQKKKKDKSSDFKKELSNSKNWAHWDPHKSRVKPEAEDGKGAHGESQAQAQF